MEIILWRTQHDIAPCKRANARKTAHSVAPDCNSTKKTTTPPETLDSCLGRPDNYYINNTSHV
ncbi:hypothetical protein B0T17DRAFT_516331 [Bombardia bombarda]|uniref:Uncharacterized protein n=1 Tax=Bombardia bombarda TaxID=252184 RepID=A0AA39XK25_9PEZI|nr:hypothetical protein B0T17DRAFT_516331 [Bombardia bombarda]